MYIHIDISLRRITANFNCCFRPYVSKNNMNTSDLCRNETINVTDCKEEKEVIDLTTPNNSESSLIVDLSDEETLKELEELDRCVIDESQITKDGVAKPGNLPIRKKRAGELQREIYTKFSKALINAQTRDKSQSERQKKRKVHIKLTRHEWSD